MSSSINTIFMANLIIANANKAIIKTINNYLKVKVQTRTNKSTEAMITRLSWKNHCDTLLRTKMFDRMYRMSIDAFNVLVQYVREGLKNIKNNDSIQYYPLYITPEIRLHCLIRFFAGGSYLDTCSSTGISKSGYYRVIWETSDILNNCHHLDLRGIPQSNPEAIPIANGFKQKSTSGVMDRCVGVVDGYFCRTITPTSAEGNVKSFYSGHYCHMGLNIQAVADCNCKFLYFAVAAPGSTNDAEAITRISLMTQIENIPIGYYVIGDSAYNASEQLLPIFYGQDRLDDSKDAWNYYASQLRIRIEMAFGLMTKKFSFLNRPLMIKYDNIPRALNTVARLHNCIIKNNPSIIEDAPIVDNNNPQLGYLPTNIRNKTVGQRGISVLRDVLVEKVYLLGLQRPKKRRRTM